MEEKYQKKIVRLEEKVERLELQNSQLKEKLSKQKEKFELKIAKLEQDKIKLNQKLESNHIIEKPFKYILDKYPEITDKVFKILNKHNVQFINRKELAKRIILLLEGDDIQKPIFTESKMMSYLNLVDSFSLQEYRQIKFAPIIKSDKALFENYEQIVRTLKPLMKVQNKTEEFSFSEFSPKEVNIEEIDEDDEELDMTGIIKLMQ